MPTTVLYDADCGFCTAVAKRLARSRSLAVEPIQSLAGERLLADLDPVARLETFHVVATGGRISGGAALVPLAHGLPGGRLLAALLARFPRSRDRAYGLVARNRHRLSRVFGLTACRDVLD